ncbi:MAG: ComF family protein [Dehalococcoidales bacterium]|nr:ComF family protein [Dehalococcoidales bacterium]
MRKAIHKFKYKRARHLAEPLAQLLLEYLDANSIDFDAIVPVPLHEARLAERGYNQSQLLAVELGKALNKAVFAECVKRTRPTQAQMSLPARKRFDNVRGAFQCTDKSLSGSRVLIIDDVCTTGATLEACAVALKRGGVSSAWGLCLARAILDYR